MSEPDTIRQGWSMTGLWLLWLSFVVISASVSVLLARKRWFPDKTEMANKSLQATAAAPASCD